MSQTQSTEIYTQAQVYNKQYPNNNFINHNYN